MAWRPQRVHVVGLAPDGDADHLRLIMTMLCRKPRMGVGIALQLGKGEVEDVGVAVSVADKLGCKAESVIAVRST